MISQVTNIICRYQADVLKPNKWEQIVLLCLRCNFNAEVGYFIYFFLSHGNIMCNNGIFDGGAGRICIYFFIYIFLKANLQN